MMAVDKLLLPVGLMIINTLDVVEKERNTKNT